MDEEQAWRLFFATGLPEAYVMSRRAARKERTEKQEGKNGAHDHHGHHPAGGGLYGVG